LLVFPNNLTFMIKFININTVAYFLIK